MLWWPARVSGKNCSMQCGFVVGRWHSLPQQTSPMFAVAHPGCVRMQLSLHTRRLGMSCPQGTDSKGCLSLRVESIHAKRL